MWWPRASQALATVLEGLMRFGLVVSFMSGSSKVTMVDVINPPITTVASDAVPVV